MITTRLMNNHNSIPKPHTDMFSLRSTTLFPHILFPPNPNPNPNSSILLLHHFSLWSMPKNPSLESALSRNRRWIVNNQIKQLLLRSPNQISTVRSLQNKFKSLDLQGRALNWLNKYPSCFQTFTDARGEKFYQFSKRMQSLVDEEQSLKLSQQPSAARRLAKLLMLARGRRLNAAKLNELKRSLGLPDDYLVGIVAARPDLFRVTNRFGRKNDLEIELAEWRPDLAVSAVEMAGGGNPHFVCSLPRSWVKSWGEFERFDGEGSYVSPYCEAWSEEWEESEKRRVGTVCEILSLTLWKKASILKLEHFWREFGLPRRLNLLLLRHPGIFYVSNRYRIYTVVLRGGYEGSRLVEKDPVVAVKEKFGELMQEGLHEYNRRRNSANVERRRRKGDVFVRQRREVEEDESEEGLGVDSMEKREERRRFYKVLFDDN